MELTNLLFTTENQHTLNAASERVSVSCINKFISYAFEMGVTENLINDADFSLSDLRTAYENRDGLIRKLISRRETYYLSDILENYTGVSFWLAYGEEAHNAMIRKHGYNMDSYYRARCTADGF